MVKVFQNIAFFMWRHLLVILMLCITAHVFYIYETISILNFSVLLIVFAVLDRIKTKWIKIDVIQKDHFKSFASFIWRHLLTFGVCSLIISVPITGRMPGIEGSIMLFVFAIFIDALKTQKKSNGSNNIHHQNHESYKHLHERNYWNSGIIGGCVA